MRLPKITEEEKRVLKHVLSTIISQEYDRVKRSRGTHYGPLTLKEFEKLLGLFQSEAPDPVEKYLKGYCPVCPNVKLCYEAACYCPQCGEEWYGDKVLKMFW